MKNPRRDQMKLIFLMMNDNGMTRIMPPLRAHHPMGFFREYINNFSFSLISPLESTDHDTRHYKFLLLMEQDTQLGIENEEECLRSTPLLGYPSNWIYMHYPLPLKKLIEQLKKLPGVGRKSAERFAFKLIDWS